MPEPTEPAETLPNETKKRDRCRALTTDGHRCKKGATYNGHLCFPHAHHRHPVLPHPSHVAIPLLEDHASIQLVLSQTAHGLLSNKLDPERARALIYACQVAATTMPRPPRMPSPQPRVPHLPGVGTWEAENPSPGEDPRVPHPSRPAFQGERVGGRESETQPLPGTDPLRPEPGGPWPDTDDDDDDEDTVYHLALDYEGLISGDGDLPAPSAFWRPASPEATPFDLIHAAPNQSKPTPRSPADPDTHENCAICDEIRRQKGMPYLHPHLQPTVNPYCKWNQPGCQGPGSDSRCRACDGVYRYDPNKYDRLRRRNRARLSDQTEESRLPHPEPERETRVPHPSRPPLARGWEAENPNQRTGSRPSDGSDEPEPQPLPNPLPDQFPDDDPMLRGYRIDDPEPDPKEATLDLNAAADPAFLWPVACGPNAVPCALWPALRGNTQNLLPSNPFTMNKTTHPNAGGYPTQPAGSQFRTLHPVP